MARHVIHGIVGCLATSVAKVPDRWKHSIKQHICCNKYVGLQSAMGTLKCDGHAKVRWFALKCDGLTR